MYSIIIVLAGSLLFFIGMVWFEGYGYEHNYMGFPIKHAKFKYYSYGTSFLQKCVEYTLKLLTGLFIISVVIFYFFRDITNTLDIYSAKSFYFLNGFLIFIQLCFYSWSSKQELKLYDYNFHVIDLEAYILSKKEDNFFYISSASILTSIAVSTYLFVYFYKTIIRESNSLDSMLFMLVLGFLFITMQIILTVLIISKIAFIDGRFGAKLELGNFYFVNKILVILLDGKKIEGNILKYYDSIYTLTKHSLQDNANIDYIIHEDKIQHIERFYKRTDDDRYNIIEVAENEDN